jgi:hypothetical protein
MKGKALLCLAIVLSMTLTLLPAIVMAQAEYMEVVFQDTGTNSYLIEDCTPPIAFSVDLIIHDVTAMWGWSTVLSWNPAVVNCTGYTIGPFNPSGASLLGVIDNVGGTIPKLAMSTLQAATVDGTGVVCTVDFLCHSHGTSPIDLTDTNYIDYPSQTKYYIDEVDGSFECQAYVGPPLDPVADFTPKTCAQYTLDETGEVTVDFDACASTGSYDPLPPPGTGNPIIEYRWDFDDDGEWDHISTNYRVALCVENITDYMASEYFLGWSCRVEFDPSELVLTSFEKGPFPPVGGWTLDGESPPGSGVIPTFVFATNEEVHMDNFTIYGESGVIAYLYFSAQACGGGGYTITVSESRISSFYYHPITGVPIVTPMDYPAQFDDCEYLYMTPDCTAQWTYDETYPGEAIDAPVTLQVFAPDCNDTETHIDFVDTDTVTEIIHILPPVSGPDIDVYSCDHMEPWKGTGKGCDKTTGEEYGPTGDPPVWSAMSDAYGPQQEVCICALVTYNGEPVENKLVAFEIRDPADGFVAFRSAATGPDGIACVSFRIPWTGATAEDLFGAWLVIATVDIAEEVVMDKMRFRFGYLVNIADIDLTPTSLYKLDTLGVTVTLANIAFTPKDVVLAVVLYDEVGVPINQFAAPLTVDPVGMVAPVINLVIPSWAFVGVGTAYVNVFDTYPSLGGTPMCPEGSENFVILNTP